MGTTIGRRERDAEEVTLRLVQEHAAELLRFARRFSLCADDAHDAYQRALEILVRRMRTEPPESPLSWLRTVIRHEAYAVREQREQLVGREEVDLDSHRTRGDDDPAERAAAFERMRQTAEALQRLKPQEITALRLRAAGRSYDEIARSQGWTYTRTNRAVTEGRRALLLRLAQIESGEECERWLPLLSSLADGEATAAELADLRPHLRRCSACRATLRRFHAVPHEVAALVPVALIPVADGAGGLGLIRHLELAAHAVAERATSIAMRLQGAFDVVPSTKVAAVAASTAALAGSGVAIERAVQPAERPVRVAAPARHGAHGAAGGMPAALQATTIALPRPSQPSASVAGGAQSTAAPGRDREPNGAIGEFALERAASPRSEATPRRRSGPGPSADPPAAVSSNASPPPAFAPDPPPAPPPTRAPASPPSGASPPPAEFAGP